MTAVAVLITGTLILGSPTLGASQAQGSGGSDAKAAKRWVRAHSIPPKKLEITTPLSKRPTKKTIALLACNLPSCKDANDSATSALKAIGWDIEIVQYSFDPEGFQSAFTRAAELKPDGVINLSIPAAFAGPGRKQLIDAGIPIADVATPAGPESGVVGSAPSPAAFGLNGQNLANFMIADSGGKASAVWIADPIAQLWAPTKDAIEKQFASGCGDCSLDELQVSLAGIGKDVPQEVVSYVQQQPDVKYLVFGIGDLTIGVAEALEQAGLDGQVKIISQVGGPLNQQNVVAGKEAMIAASEVDELGWRMVDVLARHFDGDDTACCAFPAGAHQILTKSNIKDPAKRFTIPGYRKAFKKLWTVNA